MFRFCGFSFIEAKPYCQRVVSEYVIRKAEVIPMGRGLLSRCLLTCPKYVCDKRLIVVLGTRLRFHSRYFFAYHMSTW